MVKIKEFSGLNWSYNSETLSAYAFCGRAVLDALLHANEIQTFTILDQCVERFNLL